MRKEKTFRYMLNYNKKELAVQPFLSFIDSLYEKQGEPKHMQNCREICNLFLSANISNTGKAYKMTIHHNK
jgi:hypothetical protein